MDQPEVLGITVSTGVDPDRNVRKSVASPIGSPPPGGSCYGNGPCNEGLSCNSDGSRCTRPSVKAIVIVTVAFRDNVVNASATSMSFSLVLRTAGLMFVFAFVARDSWSVEGFHLSVQALLVLGEVATIFAWVVWIAALDGVWCFASGTTRLFP